MNVFYRAHFAHSSTLSDKSDSVYLKFITYCSQTINFSPLSKFLYHKPFRMIYVSRYKCIYVSRYKLYISMYMHSLVYENYYISDGLFTREQERRALARPSLVQFRDISTVSFWNSTFSALITQARTCSQNFLLVWHIFFFSCAMYSVVGCEITTYHIANPIHRSIHNFARNFTLALHIFFSVYLIRRLDCIGQQSQH